MRRSYIPALIALALLLCAASKDNGANQHKGKAAPHAEPTKQQEPQVPLSVWQGTDTALRESITANKERAIADQKQAEANKQTIFSPAVVVNEVLALIGVGYLILMRLQWKTMQESLRVAQRAAIGIKSMSFKLAKRPEVSTVFVNFGRMSATRVRTQVRTYADTDPPEKTDYLAQAKLLPPPMEEIAAELIPNVPAVIPIETSELPDDWVEAVKEKKAYVYLVGRISYFDGFHNSETPLFCYWISTDNGIAIPVWRAPADATPTAGVNSSQKT